MVRSPSPAPTASYPNKLTATGGAGATGGDSAAPTRAAHLLGDSVAGGGDDAEKLCSNGLTSHACSDRFWSAICATSEPECCRAGRIGRLARDWDRLVGDEGDRGARGRAGAGCECGREDVRAGQALEEAE